MMNQLALLAALAAVLLLLAGCAAAPPRKPRRVTTEPVAESLIHTPQPRQFNPEFGNFERPWPFGPRNEE